MQLDEGLHIRVCDVDSVGRLHAAARVLAATDVPVLHF